MLCCNMRAATARTKIIAANAKLCVCEHNTTSYNASNK